MRTISDTDRVLEEMDRTGQAMYRGRLVVAVGTRRAAFVLDGREYPDLTRVLARIDAELPVEVYVSEKVDFARGGYTPAEVATLIREAVDFGTLKGKHALSNTLAAAIRGDA